MSRLVARAERTMAAMGWWLAFGAVLQSSACGVDDRKVGVASLQPDAAKTDEPCGPKCPEVTCPADDVCRDYPDLLPSGSCSPGGTCASAAECVFTWKPTARDGAACSCDATGCRLLPGEECTHPDACVSGSCFATDAGSNVCCAAACSPSEVCAPDGSACAAAAPCADEGRRCSGAVYQYCSGGVWQTATDCGVLGCSNERGGCLRSAGQACEGAEDCGEGSCLATADGTRVCCTGACGASCRRCAASGTACEDIADDEACGTIECPTDDVCRIYDTPSVTNDRCRAGRCATPFEACTIFEPQRADLECSPTALCDDQGNCSRAKKALLSACSQGSECSTGACVATAGSGSVCCAAACAENEVCSSTGGCVPAPICEDGTPQCSGSSFQRCRGGQWRTLIECGVLGCSLEREGCLSGAGDSCASDADCGAGRCQPTSSGSSVCCTAACDGGCRRCAPSGITCENLADDAACGDIQCPLDTTCRDYPASVDTERCVAGRCGSGEQLCIDVPRAVGQVCSANNLCDDAGNCSAPKKDPGAMCGSAGECASNFCVDGVCCNEPCNGVCETCAITGLCRGTPTDTSCPALDCNQYADACVLSNGAGRLCTGRRQCMNDCGFRAAGNDCGDGVCDGQGACVPGVSCPFADCPTVVSTCCSQITDIDTFQIQLSCLPASQLVGGACPIPDLIPSIPMRCDEHSDCPGNEVCCYSVNNVASELSCRAPSACLPDPTDFQTVRQQLCRSPKGNFACPAQAPFCAAGTDRVPGYNFCREVQ